MLGRPELEGLRGSVLVRYPFVLVYARAGAFVPERAIVLVPERANALFGRVIVLEPEQASVFVTERVSVIRGQASVLVPERAKEWVSGSFVRLDPGDCFARGWVRPRLMVL